MVEHELPQRAFQPRHLPAQKSEARTGNQRPGFEIETKDRAEIGVFPGGEVEATRGAPAADFDIVRLIRALRHIGGGQVRDDRQNVAHPLGQFAFVSFQRGERIFKAGDFAFQPIRLCRIAFAHCGANQLGGFVAAVLCFLHPGCDGPALGIERQDRSGLSGKTPPRQTGVESFRVFADEFDVVHSGGAMPPRAVTCNCPIAIDGRWAGLVRYSGNGGRGRD